MSEQRITSESVVQQLTDQQLCKLITDCEEFRHTGVAKPESMARVLAKEISHLPLSGGQRLTMIVEAAYREAAVRWVQQFNGV